ncbi:hypothetical protein [Ruthenibacterium lactatiformans]|uniref:hypothetical protein n=1 Tax=Ruthenibacterium lactatiformans TaxID=1550024 RepID=UPI00266D204B|nr:hypothetical protein [Ruthenibacterium lactatiformans]
MKHVVKPFMDQSINQAIDRNDSQAAATAIELQFPKTFSRRAWRVIRYMEGAIYLYSYKGKFVATDESLELTEYGDGTSDSPYGGPRWTGESLEELEWWLESIANEYDSLGDVPGWEVSRAMRSYPNENMRNVLVSMSADKNFVGIKTYDRQHGTRGRFLISRTVISTLLDAPKGTVRYESDCGDYAMITRLEDKLQFSFAWLNYSGDGDIKGFRQDITIPLSKFRLVLDWSESVKYLYIPMSSKALIDARPAAKTISKIMKDKRIRQAFSKAMRDCFRWPGDTVTLYPDGGYNFFFTTASGFPKNGGLILHESERDGYPYIYYSVHT